jgi:hypothetical protein
MTRFKALTWYTRVIAREECTRHTLFNNKFSCLLCSIWSPWGFLVFVWRSSLFLIPLSASIHVTGTWVPSCFNHHCFSHSSDVAVSVRVWGLRRCPTVYIEIERIRALTLSHIPYPESGLLRTPLFPPLSIPTSLPSASSELWRGTLAGSPCCLRDCPSATPNGNRPNNSPGPPPTPAGGHYHPYLCFS